MASPRWDSVTAWKALPRQCHRSLGCKRAPSWAGGPHGLTLVRTEQDTRAPGAEPLAVCAVDPPRVLASDPQSRRVRAPHPGPSLPLGPEPPPLHHPTPPYFPPFPTSSSLWHRLSRQWGQTPVPPGTRAAPSRGPGSPRGRDSPLPPPATPAPALHARQRRG